ncbi:YpdA family putative bacillithiol disulfide reductase [Cytobacillus horneckiae]|uniref:YpdA family putative bacillithiol disulfide reductase n=1 Tax=Cytobacillus horneckiae TaxID=549687 RepID=UPI00203BAE82|nr:YpdA family putative bacillithiol disulfide reductase [Cytobacillus horneckiae]MCM3180123.1 YpdA family putative bacillithiol disulfide reductase [Cytobacillus horneckiae]
MIKKDVIVIGGGPCGLAASIAMNEIGKETLVIEKGNVVNAIYRYPTHQTFFSSSEKLEIGEVPFVTVEQKPHRNQALTYYREVVKRKQLSVNAYEKVLKVEKNEDGSFTTTTEKEAYQSTYVIVATGYYDQPNYMNIPGENSSKVFHYFKEAHPFFDKKVVVVGGKNSSVDAAIELEKAGAHVTVLYRGSGYSPSVKPWILPQFDSLVRNGLINMEFEAHLSVVKEESIVYKKDGQTIEIENDFVFAMTGYHPDHEFLQSMGIEKDDLTGKPIHNPDTFETNVSGIFIAGVIAAGNNANEIFIENGRFHGGKIAVAIREKEKR